MSEIQLPVTNGSADHDAAGQAVSASGSAAPITSTFLVSGMTCGHCVAAVTEEVTAGVPGVSTVTVDLASGLVTVTGDRPVDVTAALAAVREAGYELVPGSLR